MSEALKLNPQINIQLVVQNGPHKGQRFVFSKEKISIGRSPENDIVLINDPMISRQHAIITVANNEVEISNLSQKNFVLVNGEKVHKWKLTNETVFSLGDSEFLIHIDLGKSVVAVKPAVKLVTPVAAAPKPQAAVPATPRPKPVMQQPQRMAPAPVMQAPQNQKIHFQQAMPPASPPQKPGMDPGKMRFYIIVAAVVGLAIWFFTNSDATKPKVKKDLLKYNDEVAVLLDKNKMEEGEVNRQKKKDSRQSYEIMQFETNFAKGLRDYQLGNYSLALESLQKAVRFKPDDALARNYLYLSKVRLDELVKQKMVLGDSYFQRNNFKMCASLYQQVIDMLQGQAKDNTLDLATAMKRKCEDAAEGIY